MGTQVGEDIAPSLDMVMTNIQKVYYTSQKKKHIKTCIGKIPTM